MTERLVQTPMDRYVVLEYLAEGGMGAIYLGKKLGAGGFEKEVVLKQLLPEFTQQPEFIDLFLREARLTAALDHANIVHTINLVRAADEYFMVMEYVRGGDLRTLLKRAKRRKKRMAPAAALFIAREILSALSYAHQRVGLDGKPLGLIHRDVSPSNILLSGAGEVKLTDFGIAKATTHRSVFYRVKGKVGYMSPEQARSQALQPRSDLYSVGVCLYEMLTGERLLLAVSLTTSADVMYAQPIPAVSSKVAALPKELDAVMFKALSVNPEGRFQTAGEFQEALLRVAHRAGLMAGAPDLAKHLIDLCGPVNEWGSTAVQPAPELREGTAVAADFLDGPGTEQLPLKSLLGSHTGTGTGTGMGSVVNTTERIERMNPMLDPDDTEDSEVSAVSAGGDAASFFDETEKNLPAAPPAPGPDPDPDPDPDDDSISGVDDLLWVNELSQAAPQPQVRARSRAETNHGTGRFASMELTSVGMRADSQSRETAAALDALFEEKATTVSGTPVREAPREAPREVPRVERNEEKKKPPPPKPPKPTKKPSPATEEFITERVRQVEPSVVGPRRKHTKLFVALGLVLAVGLGVALAIGLTGGGSNEAATIPTAPPPPPPKKVPPPPPPAKLTVESEPPKSRVLVEGKPRCQTPCTIDGLPAQTATLLSVEKEGYLPWMALVIAGDAAQATQHAKLRREPAKGSWGEVTIKSPTPANVLVNGKAIGWVTSAPDPLSLPPGDVVLTFTPAPGGVPSGGVKVSVRAGTVSAVIFLPHNVDMLK